MPNESQKTEKRPQTIIEKNCACIQRKIVARVRSKGPVKKKMPLKEDQYKFMIDVQVVKRRQTHATAWRPEAPPQPINTMEKVKVEMTNL
jgi:hypothetical protein